jgi:hypothetical protein
MRTLSILILVIASLNLLGGCSSETGTGDVQKINGEIKSDQTGKLADSEKINDTQLIGPPGGKTSQRTGK